jgi:hypothetical protein
MKQKEIKEIIIKGNEDLIKLLLKDIKRLNEILDRLNK